MRINDCVDYETQAAEKKRTGKKPKAAGVESDLHGAPGSKECLDGWIESQFVFFHGPAQSPAACRRSPEREDGPEPDSEMRKGSGSSCRSHFGTKNPE